MSDDGDKRAIWQKWSHIIKAEVWQAVALSFGAEPMKVPGLALDWRDGEFDECPPDFRDRLQITCNHIEDGALRAEGAGPIPFRKVRLVEFSEWALAPPRNWCLPKQFPRNPGRTATPARTAVVGADDATFREQRFDRTALPAARAETPSRSETEGEQAGASRSDNANGNDPEDVAPNKRGPRGRKKAEATVRMVEAVRNGEKTISELRGMRQKTLDELYPDAGRTTLVEARNKALKILRQNSDKTPTNDK
jgi:hypothetical protein